MEEKETVQDQLKKQTLTYVVAAFGFVAALAWNDAIKSLIEFLFPFVHSSVWIKFVYALLVTLLAVLITYQLSKLASQWAHEESAEKSTHSEE